MQESKLFICPKCGKELNIRERSYYCENGHCYDIARAGYVNLVLGSKRTPSGDGETSIAARRNVMAAGYYNKLYEYIEQLPPKGAFLDIGTADGSLPGRLSEIFPDVEFYGTDLSKFAIERAAKTYKKVCFAVANNAKLPFKEQSFDMLSAVFTTVFPAEIGRVLKRGGLFIKVTPGKDHLIELRRVLYDSVREKVADDTLPHGFSHISQVDLQDKFFVGKDLMPELIRMTPYGVKSSKSRLNAAADGEGEISLDFRVDIYRKED